MKIDKMRVAIRPMNTAQAVDLGFMMARHWFVPLWQIWLGMAFPVFVLYFFTILFDNNLNEDSLFTLSGFGILLFWLFKPLYEKPMVDWLGQSLFDEPADSKSTIKQGWKSIYQNAGKLMLRRLSPSRQLILPILQLENPDSTALKERHRLLQRGQGSGMTWHTLILMNVETIASFGVMFFLLALVPQSLLSYDNLLTFLDNFPVIYTVLWSLIYFLIASIVAPFFICGGFAVYLTKRCLLEGWDIELIFKQLSYRYQQETSKLINQQTLKQKARHQSTSSELKEEASAQQISARGR